MSSDLNSRSSELICWLTADWVTPLICAALVKLSVSARSQNTFKLSICISSIKQQIHLFVNTQICNNDLPHFGRQFHAREGFPHIRLAGMAFVSIHSQLHFTESPQMPPAAVPA